MNQNRNLTDVPVREHHRFLWFFADSAYKQNVLLATLIEKGRNVFDGPIQSLPLPGDVPNEIPRIVLANGSGTFRLQSTPDRIIIERTHDGLATSDQIAPDLALISDIFPVAREIVAGRISRVAYNRLRTFVSPDGAMALVRFFCLPEMSSRGADTPGPLSRCENFEIHAHKTYAIRPDLTINSWLRCKTGIANPEGPVISVEQDLNTLAEESVARSFGPEDAVSLLREMSNETDAIFSLYFPNGVPQ